MSLIQYLEKTYNDCSNPCFAMDFETEELVFLNQSLERKFHIVEEYTGRKATEVLHDFMKPEDFCDKYEVEIGEYIEKRIYSEALNTYLRANTTMIAKNGRKMLLTKFFMTSTDKKRANAETIFSNAITKCLEILSHPEQTTSIQDFLKLLCDFYSSDLSFICEFDHENTMLTNKYFWDSSAGEVEMPLGNKDKISLTVFIEWLKNNSVRDVIMLDGEHINYGVDTTEFQILKKYHVANVILNKLWNKDGTLLGIVGMCNCSFPVYDDRLLKAVSHFVVERFNEVSMIKALNSLNEMDLLSGFFNRSKYTKVLAELHNNPPQSLGVLFVNLNGLRNTNEYFGFEMGDSQIKKTANTLRDFFDDPFYRISGDEFVGFMHNWEKEAFEEQVDKLQTHLKSTTHESSFSLGHSFGSGSYNLIDQIKIADTVMTINKQTYYCSLIDTNEDISNAILGDLFKAIAQDEFLVYLQPQVQLSTSEVVGAEALIRRYDKSKEKMIFPDNFIPMYEKNSIIRHVDLFVIRKVCQILLEFEKYDKIIPISVNLSRVTLMEHGIVKTITDIVDEYSIPHNLIVIEITERIGLIENEVASNLIENFKSQGFKLSLDDFGCAYSNIVTLSQIEVDEVKIDKSLIDNMLTNDKNRVIVKNLLMMFNELENTFSLAEGIETEEQAEFLRSANCHLGQGYLYSRPIPNEEFLEKYIKE